ncbi:hypothetical protein MXD62_20030 [Frankia sp. Mgl5]|uniref:hypothetical protein n=1 Tax=Frankia sp. Mgl5 TaxID=2933793 RepID=UPI00200BD0A7|nr:hypothetical protein [Frankia sp. Mgl5]MCK9929440.1 hypothetical protein [Frankia sp. Mgl5]
MNETFVFGFSLVALAVSLASLLYNRRNYLAAKRRLAELQARRGGLADGGVIRFENPKVTDEQAREVARLMRAAIATRPPVA